METSIINDIIRRVDEEGGVIGNYPPKIRRFIKEKGFLVVKDGVNYTISKHYSPLVGKESLVFPKKLPKAIVKFYAEKSISINQTPIYTYGCGYPSDSWDVCECWRCKSGERRLNGYRVTINPPIIL